MKCSAPAHQQPNYNPSVHTHYPALYRERSLSERRLPPNAMITAKHCTCNMKCTCIKTATGSISSTNSTLMDNRTETHMECLRISALIGAQQCSYYNHRLLVVWIRILHICCAMHDNLTYARILHHRHAAACIPVVQCKLRQVHAEVLQGPSAHSCNACNLNSRDNAKS